MSDIEVIHGTIEEKGIYAIPVVGDHLKTVRNISDGLQHEEEDNVGVKVGKTVTQMSIIGLIAGVAMIAVL